MKGHLLKQVIEKHFHRIEKYCEKIPGAFAVEDIHELRVEYKKIRSFLRMLRSKKHGADSYKIPDALKAVYQSAGLVRDLQLFEQRLNKHLTADQLHALSYFQLLDNRLFKDKEQLVIAIENAPFTKMGDALVDHAAGSLDTTTIQKFVIGKVAAIKILLLSIETDEELHTIRKHLKDITNNIKIFRNDWNISFPVMISKNEKEVFDITTLLGEYNDLCIALSWFEQILKSDLAESEMAVWKKIQAAWLVEKQQQKKSLLKALAGLNLLDQLD